MRKISIFVLIFSILAYKSIAQQVNLTGKVINPDEKPIKNVLVYLANNPSLYCHSDSLGNFSLTDISTSVTEVRQDKIISFENRKLSLYANNQSISVDVITSDGRPIMNIVNLDKSLGTFGLYPEAYISELPKAIYIVRARIGNTFQSFKIQNIIPSGFPQGITQYDINNIADNSFTEPKLETKSETKSGVLDTLVLVHDFYKSRKIPLDSYSIQYDTIHLNNFADYSIAEGFEPSVMYWYNGYANFTNILSADSVQFIIDYDTLSILKGDLKVITIPVDKIESLDNSIKFISGLHFEPSGTQFLQSVQVSVFMKDSIPEDLVVFQCNDQGETYFIPCVSHESYDVHCIIFNINHFSSIGIGTGEIHPPTGNPEEFTTSDQFGSYFDEYMRYYESIGSFGGIPMEFFEIWFNNIVAPMITKIVTFKDFDAAFDAFLWLAETCYRLGLTHTPFYDLPFWDFAREMFCEKMTKFWNDCIVAYNGLDDKCLKREILSKALDILKLNAKLPFCPDLSSSNLVDLLNNFSNGEPFRLANEIEFPKPVKHLEVGQSFVVQYTLLSIKGDTALPEVVSWSSSNPSVATIDANGKVIAQKEGITIIKGTICDMIENTFKVEVGGFNCEEDYCWNLNDSCYSGTYKCTGVLSWTHIDPYGGCRYKSVTKRYTLVGNLNPLLHPLVPGYFETITDYEYEFYNNYTGTCQRVYQHYTSRSTDGDFICDYDRMGYFTYDQDGPNPDFCGYLKGESLILGACPEYGTIKMQCVRVDK